MLPTRQLGAVIRVCGKSSAMVNAKQLLQPMVLITVVPLAVQLHTTSLIVILILDLQVYVEVEVVYSLPSK